MPGVEEEVIRYRNKLMRQRGKYNNAESREKIDSKRDISVQKELNMSLSICITSSVEENFGNKVSGIE